MIGSKIIVIANFRLLNLFFIFHSILISTVAILINNEFAFVVGRAGYH